MCPLFALVLAYNGIGRWRYWLCLVFKAVCFALDITGVDITLHMYVYIHVPVSRHRVPNVEADIAEEIR